MRVFAPALSGVWLLASVHTQANPLDLYGFGARSTGLAGAVSADVGDPSAVYYNPAGLARAQGLQLEVGYLYAAPSLSINGRNSGVASAHGLVGGVVAPGRLFGLPFAFGLAVHIPDERISQVRALPQTQPRWEVYDVRTQRIYIAAMLALSLRPWLRAGAGMAFMASTRGSVDISGAIAYLNASETDLAHTVDVDLTSVRYPQVGVQVDLSRCITLAFTWRDSFNLDLSIDLSLRGNIVVGPIADPGSIRVPGTYRLTSRTLAAYQPEQFVLGASWVINPRWRVMSDLTWARWSGYENPTSALTTSLDVRIPPSLSMLRVPELPPSAPRELARFHDTLTVRLAAEHALPLGRHTLHLRAGYAWDPSPVPEQPGVTSFADSDRHTVSLGVGLVLRHLGAALPGALAFDLATSLQLLPPRDFTKALPQDRVGDFVASGYVFTAVANTSVRFE